VKSVERTRIVVLGYDAISPLGATLSEQWAHAEHGHGGIGPLTRFPLSDEFPIRIAGQAPDLPDRAFSCMSPKDLGHWTSPIFRYGLQVVQRTIQQIGIDIVPEISPRVATTFSSAIGGLDAVINADRHMIASGKLPHPFVNPNSCINMVTGKVAILTGATGPILSTVTACATGCTSLIIGAMLLQAGCADVAICGAVDFPLIEPIVAGFATMNGAYKSQPSEADPQTASKPFSAERRGFVMAEGAGCVVIAHERFAKAHAIPYGIALAGWSMNADAFHFVAPKRETIGRCMAEAIANAGLHPHDIDAVNAHAASTKVGDATEAEALHDVFGNDLPPLTANKSLFGHAMGAASALEIIYAMEGMTRGKLLPTINYTPDPALGLNSVVTNTVDVNQEFVLKNAFGFGGCNACVVLQNLA
jgi:3-oxoacyl-[acyl-carrier-protein] synthase II